MTNPRQTGTVIALLALVACTACSSVPDHPLPAPALDDLEPLVAERIAEATAAVSNAPSSAEAWGRLGTVYDVHRFEDEAIYCYEHARELDPNEWRWPYFSGLVLRDVDQDAATEAFRVAAELQPRYATIQFYLGFGALLREDLEAAVAAFRTALEIDPEFVNALLGLARVAFARGDEAGALVALERAKSIAPDEAAIYEHFERVYRATGKTELAAQAQAFARTSARRPQAHGYASMPDPAREEITLREGVSSKWLRGNAQRLLAARRADEALSALRAAVDVDPRPEIRLELARALSTVGRFEEANAEIDRLLVIDPSNALAHAAAGDLMARVGRMDQAAVAYKRALENDPELHDTRGNLGSVLLQSGRTEEGLEQIRQASEALPGNTAAQYNLAAALIRTGHTAEGLEALEELIERRPDYAPAHYLQGTTRQDAGDHEQSVAAFRLAIDADPDLPGVYIDLSRTLWSMGRHAEAIEALSQGVKRNPRDPDAARELAWALATCPEDALRNGTQALNIARALNSQSGAANPMILDVLAAAQAETGDFKGAAETIGAGLQIVEKTVAETTEPQTRTVLQQMLQEMRERDALYRQGTPYRQRG